MKKSSLLATILILAFVLSLGLASFIDAAAAELLIDTPTAKPTTKVTNTPAPKLTSTPTTKPPAKVTNTPAPKLTNTPTIP